MNLQELWDIMVRSGQSNSQQAIDVRTLLQEIQRLQVIEVAAEKLAEDEISRLQGI